MPDENSSAIPPRLSFDSISPAPSASIQERLKKAENTKKMQDAVDAFLEEAALLNNLNQTNEKNQTLQLPEVKKPEEKKFSEETELEMKDAETSIDRISNRQKRNLSVTYRDVEIYLFSDNEKEFFNVLNNRLMIEKLHEMQHAFLYLHSYIHTLRKKIRVGDKSYDFLVNYQNKMNAILEEAKKDHDYMGFREKEIVYITELTLRLIFAMEHPDHQVNIRRGLVVADKVAHFMDFKQCATGVGLVLAGGGLSLGTCGRCSGVFNNGKHLFWRSVHDNQHKAKAGQFASHLLLLKSGEAAYSRHSYCKK